MIAITGLVYGDSLRSASVTQQIPSQVEDERIKDDMKSQVQSIIEMEELIQLIDRRYEELELDYNETMEDLNAL